MTAIASTQADITRRNHDRAVRFFWTWLILATWLSLAGNVAHAWLSTGADARWLAACVAAVPPIVLLLSVHALAVLAKATASGAVYRAAVAATAVLAVGAFILSFVALRDLAIIAGIRPGLAPVLPLVIDLAIGVATLALVAIGDKPARRARNPVRGMASPATTTATPNRATATEKRTLVTTATRNDTPAAASAASPSADDAARELAAELVAEKVTRHPIAVVERIIAAHDAGDPPNRIAKNSGVHHSTVSRVVDAATARRQRALAIA
ncbi:hypothetical protein A5668_01415 [Mycolicibacterium fortuitum]|uniref:DUF2637 domain-containing protein n=1 Tax=Mycolicibacterium fortuitum TaxID=1766 RepID=UPI0007EA162B|nr:DUF2637 domain-containing protein [Mycolicibacterium fortuitum]OBB07099.1 hypothetical protein A5668_01415 [Mycolicibacterium fortuitum]SKV33544.1 Protein of uncharacterised function (DUF2637) [Mycobacteroides abscessus subsp. abscessus]